MGELFKVMAFSRGIDTLDASSPPATARTRYRHAADPLAADHVRRAVDSVGVLAVAEGSA